MSELGFDQLSIEPVVSDAKLEYSIKEEDLPRVFEEYETLAREMIKRKNRANALTFPLYDRFRPRPVRNKKIARLQLRQ